MPKHVYLKSYPRRVDAPRVGQAPFVGVNEMAQLTEHSMFAGYKWFETRKLPLSDGPLVYDRPTWSREIFLAWAYRNKLLVTVDGEPRPFFAEGRRLAEHMPPELIIRASVLERKK